MLHEGERIEGQDVRIDGNTYRDCTFVDCTLRYGGSSDIGIQGCTFEEVQWEFDGEAANTLAFLSSMYHRFGEGGRTLVEHIFESIRAGPESDGGPPGPSPPP